MPEAKNTFIQSKMNKDMDGRIIPNGQYRDGQNVQISRSEGDDVGALENVLGNELLTDFGLTNPNLEIIGHLTNDTLDCIFLFLTDYTDCSPDQLSNNISGIGGECYIIQYTLSTNNFRILVEGDFLNFSKTHPVLGVTLLESLLFWTDNRNQPRKINIDLAETGFYTNEDQISVAKYYPYEPISLLEQVAPIKGRYQSSMKDKFSDYLPIHAAAKVKDVTNNNIVLIGEYTNIRPGGAECGDLMSGLCVGLSTQVSTVSIDTANNETTITVVQLPPDLDDDCIVYFQRQNPDKNPNWPGDPDYLKEKFVRFSYRFKFVDGEYSLSAPFTQIAFVPEQDGYFIGDNSPENSSNRGGMIGDEGRAIDSTIVSFMQNKINDIGLYIPAPTKGNNDNKYLFSEINESLNIIEIDILYKAADSNKTTIVDTLTLENFGSFAGSYYEYEYQSRKPWKTLPPIQTTRVNDIVPVRALSQESAGNRIMYGNFIDKHTSPINLNYTLQINQKDDLPGPTSPLAGNRDYYVRKEYQNHTLKQNRTYQVGVVLSDRYGRQSNVILSSVLNPLVPDQNGSTIYHRYKNAEDPMLLDKYPEDTYTTASEADPYTWPGDQLNAVFYSIIPKLKTQDGYPGIYSVADGTVTNLIINSAPTYFPGGGPNGWNPLNNCSIPFSFGNKTIGSGEGIATFDTNGTLIGLEILFSTSGFENGQSVTLDFATSSQGVAFPIIPGCDISQASAVSTRPIVTVETSIDNPLGWYSYKFVVKQTEQEYYNVYLPTTLAGYPCDVTGQEAQGVTFKDDGNIQNPAVPLIPKFEYPKNQESITSHIVLFSDNINKVPRDLQEVGPTQELYRSSQRLYGRVNNIVLSINGRNSISNVGFDPGLNFDVATQVATMTRLGLGDLLSNPAIPIIPNIFYNGETNPAIGVIQTNKQFGIATTGCNAGANPPNPNSTKYGTTLSVYETEPVESLLDIFWETTSSGLISELNNNILTEDNTIPVGITDPQLNWNEADGYNAVVSSTFEAASISGAGLGAACSITLDSVVRGDGVAIFMFELEEQGVGTGEYVVKIKPGPNDPGGAYMSLFKSYVIDLLNTYYFNFTITRDNGIDPITIIQTQAVGTCQNVTPYKREPSPEYWDLIKKESNLRYFDPSLDNDEVPFSNWTFMPEDSIILDFSTMPPCSTGENTWFLQINQFPGYGIVKGISTKFGTTRKSDLQTIDNYYLWFEGENFDCDPANDNLYPLLPLNCDDQSGTTSFNGLTHQTLGTYDGVWGVYNGSYGSVPPPNGPIFPPSSFCGDDIVWTISRMYQVSTFIALESRAFEWFFGLGPLTPQFPVDPANPKFCPNMPVQPGGTTDCIFSTDYCCMPNSPIYWHNSADNPTPGQMQAENKVGAKYNEGQHYWPDIQHAIVNQIEILNQNDPNLNLSLSNHPAMQIQDGYNTFYQRQQVAPLNFWSSAPANAGGYKYYIGLTDSNKLGDPLNKRYRFNIDQLPQTFTDGGFSEPIRANIFAGDKTIAQSGWELSAQGGNISFEQAATEWLSGNGVPGGRYVVTIRATDRSTVTQNFGGLFTEYDVPVYVPSFRLPSAVQFTGCT